MNIGNVDPSANATLIQSLQQAIASRTNQPTFAAAQSGAVTTAVSPSPVLNTDASSLTLGDVLSGAGSTPQNSVIAAYTAANGALTVASASPQAVSDPFQGGVNAQNGESTLLSNLIQNFGSSNQILNGIGQSGVSDPFSGGFTVPTASGLSSVSTSQTAASDPFNGGITVPATTGPTSVASSQTAASDPFDGGITLPTTSGPTSAAGSSKGVHHGHHHHMGGQDSASGAPQSLFDTLSALLTSNSSSTSSSQSGSVASQLSAWFQSSGADSSTISQSA